MKAVHNLSSCAYRYTALVTSHVKLQNESSSQHLVEGEEGAVSCDFSRKITK